MTPLARRAFLRQLGFGTLSAAAAALTWDVERLLWVPGERTILLPSAAAVVDPRLVDPQAFVLHFSTLLLDGGGGKQIAPVWVWGRSADTTPP